MTDEGVDADCEAPVVVVGASAGGVEALQRLVGLLPADLAAAVLVVLHVSPSGMSVLPHILSRAGALRAAHAVDGEKIEPGRIYVAPPDRHMVIDGSLLRVTLAPSENGHRPAIDPLFRSAARCLGRRAVGVLLSGMLDDGVAGLSLIHEAGGLTLVQSPDEAAYPSMPLHAIEQHAHTHILPLVDIAAMVIACAGRSHRPAVEEVSAPLDEPTSPMPERADTIEGAISPFTCPSCGGTLWEMEDRPGMTRYRCRTGHAFSTESFLDVQAEALDDALWGAYRSLLERADLARRMSRRFTRTGVGRSSERYAHIAEEAEARARVLHRVLVSAERPQSGDDAVT